MSDLDDIPLRLNREGRWQALCIGKLSFITDAEIDQLGWAGKLREMLEESPDWEKVEYGWKQG